MSKEFGSFDYSALRGSPETALRVSVVERGLDRNRPRGGEERVLEVGVGGGDVTEMLARRYGDVTVVDVSGDKIEAVRARLAAVGIRHVRFIVSAVEASELPARSFAHVVLSNLLEHLEDPVAVMRRLAGLLAAEGGLHITVPLANSIHRWLGVAMGLIPSVGALAESDRAFGHYRVYSQDSIAAHVKEAGLDIVYSEPFYFKPLTTAQLAGYPREVHHGLFELGRRFPEFASYMYLLARIRARVR